MPRKRAMNLAVSNKILIFALKFNSLEDEIPKTNC